MEAAPPIGLRARILGLAAACVAGGLLLAAGLALHRAMHEQAALEASALSAARTTIQAADREIAAAIARLEALSTSPALRAGDLRAFGEQLAATPSPDGTWFVLSDTERQLLNTLRPFNTAPLPRLAEFSAGSQAAARRMIATRQPEVSPVVWGVHAGSHVVAVTLPVVIGGEVTHLLDNILSDRRIRQVVDEQQLPQDWRDALIDRYGATIALNATVQRPTGPGVPEAWREHLRSGRPEGTFNGTRDSTKVFVAFARSPMSDWTAVVEVPESVIAAPIRQATALLAGGGMALLALGAALALLVARATDGPLQALRISAAEAHARRHETEARYRTYWRHTGEGLFALVATTDGRFVFEGVNPAYERMSGLHAAELAGRDIQESLSPLAAQALADLCRRCIATGKALQHEDRIDLPTGRHDWETSLAPVRDPASGRILRLLGNVRDVTDRRRSEAALRKSEERLRRAMEAAAIATWDWDPATGRIAWSGPLDMVLGSGEADGWRDWADVVHPEDRGRVSAEMAEAVAARRPFRCEFRSAAGGAVRWLLCRGSVVSPPGMPLRVLGYATDVTERKRIETGRDQALALFRGIAETSPDIVYVLDIEERRLLYANRRVAEILGYGLEDVEVATDETLSALFHPADGDETERRGALAALADGAIATSEHRVRNRDGDWRWLSTRETVFARNAEGKVKTILGCAHDITSARHAEEALRGLGGRLMTLQDDERRRITRELHDSTAQILVGASFAVARIRAATPNLPQAAEDAVNESLSLIEESQREIRTLAYLLHPPLLDEMGLPAALRWYAKGLARRSALTISVEVAPELEGQRLPPDVESALFRIAQEALGNAHRHSGGTAVRVRLGQRQHDRPGAEIFLSVEDDGLGIMGSPADRTEGGTGSDFGVGLPGMRERMRQLDGRLTLRSAEPHGTIVEAAVPYRPAWEPAVDEPSRARSDDDA